MRIALGCCSLQYSKHGCNNVHRLPAVLERTNNRSLSSHVVSSIIVLQALLLSEKVIPRYVQPEEHICNCGRVGLRDAVKANELIVEL